MIGFARWVLTVAMFVCLSQTAWTQSATLLEDFDDARSVYQGTAADEPHDVVIIDADNRLSVDRSALRLPPPKTSTWGRMGVSSGPYAAVPGLSMAVRVRIGDCLVWDEDRHKFAVGWFPERNPSDPTVAGHSLLLARNAKEKRCALNLSHETGSVAVLPDMMQIDLHVVGMIRHGTVMYYVTSAEGVPNMAPYPYMRPIAFGRVDADSVYAGLHQRYERDDFHATRVERINVDTIAGYASWYGTAYTADRLLGDGEDLVGSRPQKGTGKWEGSHGRLRRTRAGVQATVGGPAVAHVDAVKPAGLLRAVIENGDQPGGAGLYFRGVDDANYWYVGLSGAGARLLKREDGEWTFATRTDMIAAQPQGTYDVWVQDDGRRILCYVNGRLALATSDTSHAEGTRVGIMMDAGSKDVVRQWEAHARHVEIPSTLQLGAPYARKGDTVLLSDSFQPPSGDLAGRALEAGGETWEKGYPSKRRVVVQEVGGARVEAENLDFMAYSVPFDWKRHGFIDVSSDMIPPEPPHEGHVGIVLLQDAQNFLMLGWDTPSGHYGLWCTIDDTWVPVDLIYPDIPRGSPFNLRATFDGDNYALYMNGEPIIVSKISDTFPDFDGLTVKRVGIGLTVHGSTGDQGTVFRNFIVRR